jgi:hypothetical protein
LGFSEKRKKGKRRNRKKRKKEFITTNKESRINLPSEKPSKAQFNPIKDESQ